MKRLLYLITGLSLTFLLLAGTALSVQASPKLQNFVTPTPGPDGRIIFVVQEGQNCTMIANITGVPLSQLRALNRLDENCTLRIGQQLLIGMGGPADSTATPTGAAPTATPAQAIPTTSLGGATVCVLLYDDLNGDALHQDTEVTIPDGAVSVTGTSGQYSKTANTTSGTDPLCFENVVQGTYNISVAAPEGYNPTTQLNYTLDIKTGEQIFVDFGAQQGGQAKPQDPTSEPGSNNLLGIAGGILLLAAIGLGLYAWMVYGRRSGPGLRKPPIN
ncbi:MAG TPA: LysM peptidoglycan-binding domain-containing protein [Anaerolineales bacterium]|jgi:hypothetical protein